MDQSVPLDSLDTRFRPAAKYRGRGRPAVWRGVVASSVVIAISVGMYPQLPRHYTASSDVLLRPTDQNGATTWDQSVRDAMDDNAVQTKTDIMRSVLLQQKVVNRYHLTSDPEYNPSLHGSLLRSLGQSHPWLEPWLPQRHDDETQVRLALTRHLIIKRERKSYVIQVGYESADPVKAATLTNALVQAFLVDQIGRKRESHEAVLAALNDRVTSLQAQYHRDEQAEHAFVISAGLLHQGDLESTKKQLETVSKAIGEIHLRAVETAAHAAMLTAVSQRPGGLENTEEVLSSVLLQRLRERWVQMTSGAGAGTVPAGATEAVKTALRTEIEAQMQHVVKAVQNSAAMAQQTEIALRLEIARLDARLVQWNENERQRAELGRVVAVSSEALKGAESRYMQEAGRGDVLQPDVEIVSAAGIPDRPSSPTPMFYGAGTLALLVLINGLLLLPNILRATARAR